MIKKIKKIINAGIFGDYSWDGSLPEFKKYNLIYGWNWSGKSTLSSVFAALETGVSEDYPTIEYEIETQRGDIKHGVPYSKKVRVFNQNYIAKNVPVLSGKAKPIFLIGEENIKLAVEIKNDEQLLLEMEERLKRARANKNEQEEKKDKLFTDIAKTISANTSGEATRTYRKPNAETAFRQLSAKEVLDESDIDNYNLTLRQIEKPSVNELSISKTYYRNEDLELDALLTKIISEGNALCAKTVDLVVIDRLKQNNDISKWVEEGVALHEKHNSTICEYCNQNLPVERIKELTNYFNEEDKLLKEKIDLLVGVLNSAQSLIDGIKPIDKANLYDEIQQSYQAAIQTFETSKKYILENILNLGILLKDKKAKTTESVKLETDIDMGSFIAAVDKINVDIRKHNMKTGNFKTEKSVAQKLLEKHYLSTIYDDVKDLEAKMASSEAEIKILKDGDPVNLSDIGINSLKKKITEDKAKISSTHKACDEINKGLEGFLGRNEIVFEVEEEGYVINRNGKIANHLSEGEKTAITFVYFTVHLRDQDFDIRNGVVVIDDPVSSFDSNSLFQAFAFLKNAVKDAKQIFILTHSFDFLRLLLNWVKHMPDKDKSHYMVKNKYMNEARQAYIAPMDKELKVYESEYHYIFKILHTFKSNGTIDQAYPIPNIARKVLETFLMFPVPNSDSFYNKMETLKPLFDENKLTAIYKFTNDLSHITGKGFDPALVMETQKNVAYLLEMMEKVFPEHYKILVESISPCSQSLNQI